MRRTAFMRMNGLQEMKAGTIETSRIFTMVIPGKIVAKQTSVASVGASRLA
jgi:hypothetical protein